jgi:hypothetical protein
MIAMMKRTSVKAITRGVGILLILKNNYDGRS